MVLYVTKSIRSTDKARLLKLMCRLANSMIPAASRGNGGPILEFIRSANNFSVERREGTKGRGVGKGQGYPVGTSLFFTLALELASPSCKG
ncbi:hypothetical protein JTE90_011794 [Oedothorax gibbosus]|uniref:Reverse transcriptase domain-containing protein n=1 Tax=Oedothorax gibbosus TaxID=931172 RepID=A0AAV6VTG3_9ARAC|nr:hypothetical protein JTE90_011794 [Oedothorax gibbosus]